MIVPIIICTFAFSGCKSFPKPEPLKLSFEHPPQISPNTIIGHIVEVDTTNNTTIIALNTLDDFSSQTDLTLKTRNPKTLSPTAELAPTSIQKDRILGAQIIHGTPNKHDQVIITNENGRLGEPALP